MSTKSTDTKVSSAESDLIEAARRYSFEVSHKRLKRITMTLDDGSRRTITVNTHTGWQFGSTSVTFKDLTVSMRGKTLATLKRLVEDEIVTDADLIATVWGGEIEAHTLAATVSELRRVLKTDLGIEGNPIERIEGGYRFTV